MENERYLLEIKNLSVAFGGLKAVDDVDINVKKNELYGLIGPNGAGKTTVFNLITGVHKPDKGSIVLDGENISGLSTPAICRAGVARTFQNIRLFEKMSVLDNVKAGLNDQFKYSMIEGICRIGRYKSYEEAMNQKAMDLLKVFELDEYESYKASQLPYGKQRKLEIARALATEPKLLLLDEPAAGMNPLETQELMDTIKFIRDEFDMTVLLIEHDMKLVSGICDEITVLSFGSELKKGITKEVLNDPEVIKAYLGD